MQLIALLLVSISLITNNKINYFDLVLAEALSVLFGLVLWTVGLDLWRGRGRLRKLSGAVLLLLALGYSLGWLGLNYWEYTQLRNYF